MYSDIYFVFSCNFNKFISIKDNGKKKRETEKNERWREKEFAHVISIVFFFAEMLVVT